MSYWTYVNGTITVSPMGRTQEEKEYILKTVLKHLPNVSGSEQDMFIKIIEKENGCKSSSSHDEFGRRTDNLIDRYGQRNYHRGSLIANDDYIIVVSGSLRDREFEQTYRKFINWLTRLAKRVEVEDVLVEIKGYDRSEIIRNNQLTKPKRSWETKFGQMFEKPSWVRDASSEPNWCEYLMWDRGINTSMPMLLEYKYYDNEENDEEVERRKFKK